MYLNVLPSDSLVRPKVLPKMIGGGGGGGGRGQWPEGELEWDSRS